MAKKVKLADIATALDVSTVTVSKALSNQKGVSEEMRVKIKDLARELGYQQPSAGNRVEKQHFNIGIIIPEQYLEKYEYFYWQLYRKIHKSIKREESREVLEILEMENEQKLTLPDFVTERKVAGIIVIGKLSTMYEVTLQEEKIPVVYVESFATKGDCDAVISNGFYGAYMMTQYLLNRGHRKIGFVGSYKYDTRVTDRYLGFCKAMMEQGQTAEPLDRIEDRDPVTKKIDAEVMILPEDNMPSAFVCSCDLSAAILIGKLRENGYRVPQDVSVVGFDNSVYPGLCELPLTTFEVQPSDLAKRAVTLLLNRLNAIPEKKGIRVVEGRIIPGDTVRTME